MEPHELIVCRDVSLGYEGQTVLSHLNLTIRDGDYLCIVGDNGSGKSTLLRGLLGLLAPQSGEILRAPELERGAVGYLPQQTRAQRDFPATVLEAVSYTHLIFLQLSVAVGCGRFSLVSVKGALHTWTKTRKTIKNRGGPAAERVAAGRA